MNTICPESVLWFLSKHTGEAAGVSAAALVAEICECEPSATKERHLRESIEQLRREGHHICGTPATGYYIAANDEELVRTVAFLHDRAMTSLCQAAAMRKVSLPDLRGQLRLPLNTGTSRRRKAAPDDAASNTEKTA